MEIRLRDYGAVGDGVTLNTCAIQKALDTCSAMGGGRVIVDGGTYVTGTILLKQNVELYLAADGVLKASSNGADFPERDNVMHVDSERLPRWKNGCMIYAEECENIAITGPGVIDVSGDRYVVLKEDVEDPNRRGWLYKRIDGNTPSRCVWFCGCKNVRVEDITITNQPACWSFWVHDCDFVHFDKVKVLANVNYPNNDGIHINASRNVTVSNCTLVNGDDCIIVRCNNSSLKQDRITEKVVVTNCTLTSYAAGILVGFVNCGHIRDCSFSNIVMNNSSWGIRTHMPHIPAGTGIGYADLGRNESVIENISFSNIIMNDISSVPVSIFLDDDPAVKCRAIRNYYFSNIHARSTEFPILKGRADMHLQHFYFNDCTFEMTDGSEFGKDRFNRPSQYLDTNHHPMVLRYIDDLHFNNTEFRTL